jgi:hypothetical protein
LDLDGFYWREQLSGRRAFLLNANRAGEACLATASEAATEVADDFAQAAGMTAMAVTPGAHVIGERRPAIFGLARPGLSQKQQTRDNQYVPHGNKNRFFPG